MNAFSIMMFIPILAILFGFLVLLGVLFMLMIGRAIFG